MSRTMNPHLNDSTYFIAGTSGGTALTILGVASPDIAKTIVLATFGAVVSFTVTLVLRWSLKKFLKYIGRG